MPKKVTKRLCTRNAALVSEGAVVNNDVATVIGHHVDAVVGQLPASVGGVDDHVAFSARGGEADPRGVCVLKHVEAIVAQLAMNVGVANASTSFGKCHCLFRCPQSGIFSCLLPIFGENDGKFRLKGNKL